MIRPRQITYTGDGTGIIAGAASPRSKGSQITWTTWTSQAARGTGYDQSDDCRPDCASGTYHGYPVNIVAWRPRIINGSLVFSRLTLFFTHSVPFGKFRHYTFTAERVYGSGLGYSPPGSLTYCSHRDGEKPDPACRNIHALPHL